ncbi:hypothetical protein [Novosphingobium sp. JCM 18896]|uniref:hypothetical protein n=1 Tax=Novosphingobium sp. JCM 18896 TaxID=2989731 RepID=UPI0022225E3B|nr:hypothetical protein [Novosphingobium sp. JCM 18896]MCW1431361.1 hypothetical protein [Novosphingobium sp. JCM 18896]
MNVYYEQIEDEEITRELVAEETDTALLAEWYADLRQVENELATMIGSLKLVDAQGTTGMARKLGYTRIACNWITKRLAELGEEVPDNAMSSKFRRMKQHLTDANRVLEKKNAQLKELRARVAELEGQLSRKAA